MASATVAIPLPSFGAPTIPAPPPWLGAAAAGLYLGAQLGNYLYEKYPGVADNIVDAFLGPRSQPVTATMPQEVWPGGVTTPEGWFLVCGGRGGQFAFGATSLCPPDPSSLIVTPLGNINTPVKYVGSTVWELVRFNDKPGFLPHNHPVPDLTRIENIGLWWCEDAVYGGAPPAIPEPITVAQPAPTAMPRADEVPAVRDWKRLASIEEALGLSERGYAEPVSLYTFPGYRPDVYRNNPGITFGWTYAPAGTVRPSAPGVSAPPLVRPVPGVAVGPQTGTVTVVTPGTVTQTQTVPVTSAPSVLPPRLFPSRPADGTKEKKGRMTIQGAAASLGRPGTAGLRLFNMATEFCDAVEALWDAIPFDVKLKRGFVKKLPKSARKQEGKRFSDLDKKNWSKPGCLKMAAQVNEAWKEMHLPTAVKNLIQEHIEDRVIGGLAQKASKAHAGVQRRLRSSGASPLLGPTL